MYVGKQIDLAANIDKKELEAFVEKLNADLKLKLRKTEDQMEWSDTKGKLKGELKKHE